MNLRLSPPVDLRCLLAWAAACLIPASLHSQSANGDLSLWNAGKTGYQIVLPDTGALPAATLTGSLQQTARMLQTAFEANGVKVSVVQESQREPSKPGIYLGQTKYAAQQVPDALRLEGWGYVQQVVGENVIIAGHDALSRLPAEAKDRRQPGWDFVGTAKGAADFAREHLGVRFLYPDLPSYSQVADAAKVDLMNSPAIEFLKKPAATVPRNLKVDHAPLLKVNTSHPANAGFYDLSLNRFPRVDSLFGGHTWARAVPPEQYAKSHPEYFALVNGERQAAASGNAQYCLSNPQVQELIYQDLVRQLENGYTSVDLGQPDGYQECQCKECGALYGTGDDWGEKIWTFNRQVAERLLKSHPQGRITMMSYILTARPPKTFKAFPANVNIMLTGTNETDIAPWRDYEVPGGFSGYVYNWCPNLVTRYTPMRTPGFVETQVKRLAENKTQSLLRDGPGQLFGLEGPVYYTMGRMFDNPTGNSAAKLVSEFCEAAFGSSAPAMLSFYDRLYHAINLYSDHIGTRGDAWSYQTYDGRRRKTVTDPFPLIAFLYPPQVLAALENDLALAESLAATPKVKTRLALVRTEFDYLRHLAKVVHLYQAFVLLADAPSRDQLLNAIDARNEAIDALYKKGPRTKAAGDWAQIFFPFSGHSAEHLRLAHDGYQEPFANTCFNWDTKNMRNAPLPGKKRLPVTAASSVVTLDPSVWAKAEEADFTRVPPFNKLPRKSSVRALYDESNLYLLLTSELEPEAKPPLPGTRREQPLGDKESVDIYLAPQAGQELAYRFMTGIHPTARYDALNGAVTDVMDPRHGKDDPAFQGEWEVQSHTDVTTRTWQALVTIPFQTLGTAAPTAGIIWRANFARNHPLIRDQIDRYIWSSAIGNGNMNDRSLFGDLEFR